MIFPVPIGQPTVAPMHPGEEAEVSELVGRLLEKFIAPHFSAEGVVAFWSYVQPDALARRSRADHHVLLARSYGTLWGMIELRGWSHISLLFVGEEHQRRGIARRLLGRSLELLRQKNPALARLTVKATPNAVTAYVRMGFVPDGPERVEQGVRTTPMALELGSAGGDLDSRR